MNVTLLPVFQFYVIHFKTLPCTKTYTAFWQYILMHFFTVFLVWHLLITAHIQHEC